MAINHGGDIFGVARTHGWDWRDVLDFSASINPLGPAPGVRAAICNGVDRISHYPEREPFRLRSALAKLWGLEEDQLILGNGATELIYFAARMWSSSTTTLALPVFSEFHRAFPNACTAVLTNPGTWPKHGLLVLTRPANPTGWSLDLDELQQYLSDADGPVLVDESFLEYTGLPSAATLIGQFPRLVILRSLTKFYALPGLRIGAIVCSHGLANEWRRHREPWQVNVLAEEAALASLADLEHSSRSLAFMRTERDWLFSEIQAIAGVHPEKSTVNFLYVRLDYSASRLCNHLSNAKILVRNCDAWPGLSGEAVRIAVRTRNENERLLQTWREFRLS